MAERKYDAESVTDLTEIQKIVKIPDEFSDREPHILGHLALSGALYEGHFELTSGLHSRYFLRTFNLEGRSDWYEHLGRMVVERLKKDNVKFDKTLSVSDSAFSLGEEILKASNKSDESAITQDSDQRNFPLKEIVHPFFIFPNDKVVLIDDVMQSSSTLERLNSIARRCKAKPVAVVTHACMDSEELKSFGEEKGYPVYALVDLQQKDMMWTPRDCSLCISGPKLITSWTL
jgi:orotate phosphoribosyltransferase